MGLRRRPGLNPRAPPPRAAPARRSRLSCAKTLPRFRNCSRSQISFELYASREVISRRRIRAVVRTANSRSGLRFDTPFAFLRCGQGYCSAGPELEIRDVSGSGLTAVASSHLQVFQIRALSRGIA